MKKIFLFLVALLGVFILVGCESPKPTEDGLETPEISIVDNIVKWNKIDGATEYVIYINNNQYAKVKETEYKLYLNKGTYEIYVSAKNDNEFSGFSNKVTYIQEDAGEEIKLATPVISINDNIVTWDAIQYAGYYEVYDNGEFYKSTIDTSINLYFSNGLHIITVKAKSKVTNITESDFSNEVAFTPMISTKTGNVNIFEINDTHGSFITDSDSAGIDKVSTIINELSNDDLIKLANGDIFQGGYVSNKTYGRCFIDALNELKFDAFIIGNHEFDWGLDMLANYKDGDLSNGEAIYPFLGANIVYADTQQQPEYLDDYIITECNGFKVGVIGTIGESLTSSISAERVKDFNFLNPVPIVEKLSKELRTKYGCDVVVVSEHDYNERTNHSYSSLSGDSRIDAIVCGHTHKKISEKINGSEGRVIPVIESNANNISVGMIQLQMENNKVVNSVITHYDPSSYMSDTNMNKIFASYQTEIDEGEVKVGYTDKYLNRSDLGKISTTAMKNHFNADLGVINKAGVRDSIDQGDIKVKNVFKTFPFDNLLIKVYMKGSTLINFINKEKKFLYFSDYPSNIDKSKIYTIIVIDYVFTNPYDQKYFAGCDYEETNVYIRDVFIEHFKGTINE